jgi:hypothetical protein
MNVVLSVIDGRNTSHAFSAPGVAHWRTVLRVFHSAIDFVTLRTEIDTRVEWAA